MVVAVLALPAAAHGADGRDLRTVPKSRAHAAYTVHAPGPYPWSRRAAKIRLAERCWRACLAESARDFQACLRVARPTACVAGNAAADRYCLRACRLGGGPLVRLAD